MQSGKNATWYQKGPDFADPVVGHTFARPFGYIWAPRAPQHASHYAPRSVSICATSGWQVNRRDFPKLLVVQVLVFVPQDVADSDNGVPRRVDACSYVGIGRKKDRGRSRRHLRSHREYEADGLGGVLVAAIKKSALPPARHHFECKATGRCGSNNRSRRRRPKPCGWLRMHP